MFQNSDKSVSLIKKRLPQKADHCRFMRFRHLSKLLPAFGLRVADNGFSFLISTNSRFFRFSLYLASAENRDSA